jgi:glycosyltransferase involved in cell wall biosynthesis
MGDPTFTVVTKAYNEEALVGNAIRSALAQTRDDFELIVVDDGSTDGTADVVRGFESDPRVRLLSQPNRGVAAAMNAGIGAGRAPYVALLDADDLWMPTYLERMGAALDADGEAGFAYTDAWWLDDRTGRFFKGTMSEHLGAPTNPPRDPNEMLKLLLPSNWLFGLTTIRRSALARVGGVNESLRGSEDYELWIRLLASGYGAVRVPGRLVVWRDRGGSLSADERGMALTARQVYQLVTDQLDVPDDVKALAREQIGEVDRELELIDGRARVRSALRALRRRLGRLRRALLPGSLWRRETPPEVAAAFPDLDWGPAVSPRRRSD